MNDNDNQMIERFFSEARQQTVDDNGFSDRVMRSLPDKADACNHAYDAASVRMQRLSRLWTMLCVAAGIVLMVLSRAWELPLTYVYVFVRTLPTWDIDQLCLLPLLTTTLVAAALWIIKVDRELF